MTDNVSLGWLFTGRLTMDDQVALLNRPHDLPDDLVQRLQRARDVSVTDTLADTLDYQRGQLDRWWEDRTPEQQAYLIEQRAGELDEDYADTVQAASADPVNDPNALVVVVVRDLKNNNRFRLPPMVDVYVEMKTRES